MQTEKLQLSAAYSPGQLDSRQFNGRFFLVLHDDQRREQVVITDRLGSMHGYYVLRGDRVCAIGTDLAGE